MVLARFTIDTKVSGLPSKPEEKNRFIHDHENLQKLTKKVVIQEGPSSKTKELQEYRALNTEWSMQQVSRGGFVHYSRP